MPTENYMITVPDTELSRQVTRTVIENWDIHKWIVGFEEGKEGYKHLQIRMKINQEDAFEKLRLAYVGQAHIEECSDTWEYESKSGNYYTSEDTLDILNVRFGVMNETQEEVVYRLKRTNDRQVMVWVDEKGNCGKTWLTAHLWERRLACYVPPTMTTPKEIIQWVCSAYNGEPYIIIDIPRSWKWTPAVYIAIETIKDGLVYDSRYSAKMRNIRGVKVLVMTNVKPKLDKLSKDRWLMFGGTHGSPVPPPTDE